MAITQYKRALAVAGIGAVCASAQAQTQGDLPEFQYVGYRVVHHLGVQIDNMERIGFNTFEHPPIADYRSFVITGDPCDPRSHVERVYIDGRAVYDTRSEVRRW